MPDELVDANTAEDSSPTAQPDPGEAKEPTLLDTVQATAAASLAAEGTPTEKPDASPVQSLDPTKEGAKPPVEKEEIPTAKAPDAAVPDDKLPFHEHPRWKEVMSQKTEAETKLKELSERTAEIQPLADAQTSVANYCQQNNITPEQYREVLETQALINNDPAKALEKLRPLYEHLQALTGTGNTYDKDLQERLATGKIDEDIAREVMKHRASARLGEQRQQRTQADMARQHQAVIDDSVRNWDMTKRTSDPAFKPVENGGIPGKWEMVQDRLTSLWATSPPRTAQDAVKLAERAFSDVSASLARFIPRPAPTRRALPVNGSSANPSSAPKTLKEAVFQAAEGTYSMDR